MNVPPQSSPHKFAEVLEARVVGFCKKTNAKRKKHFAVYSIDVSFAAAQWSVQRRFSDFVKFSSNVRSTFPTLTFLSIPSRLQKSLDPGFLEKRRQKLNSFIIDVLDQVPLVVPILKCEVVMQFLEVMKHLEKHFASDKRTKGREFFPDLYASFPINKKAIHLNIQHGMDKGEDIPIHIAAKEGNCEEVSAIVKAKPGAMATTDFLGQTALHVSSRHGQAPVIRLLLVLGADRNIQDKRGWTPLHCASTSSDLQSVLLLLDDEAVIPDLQNVDGNTPLHYFVRNFSSAPPDMLKDVLAIFSKRGCDVNTQNKSGETPLHMSCWRGSFPLVATLLASGADPNLRTLSNEAPVQWAIREGKNNIAHFLIQNGAVTDKSIFDPALVPPAPEVVERPSEEEEEDFDEDDTSDYSDDESNEKSRHEKNKQKRNESDSSPSNTPPSTSSPSNASSPSNLSPPTKSSSSTSSSSFSPPNSSSTSISPSSSITSSSSSSPPSTSSSGQLKFVMGTHSRNHAPSSFLPVLASPKRLLRPAEHEVHHQQLVNQQMQLSPNLQSSPIPSYLSQSPQNPESSPQPPSDTSSLPTTTTTTTHTHTESTSTLLPEEPTPQPPPSSSPSSLSPVSSSTSNTSNTSNTSFTSNTSNTSNTSSMSNTSSTSPSPSPRSAAYGHGRPRSGAPGVFPPSPLSLSTNSTSTTGDQQLSTLEESPELSNSDATLDLKSDAKSDVVANSNRDEAQQLRKLAAKSEPNNKNSEKSDIGVGENSKHDDTTVNGDATTTTESTHEVIEVKTDSAENSNSKSETAESVDSKSETAECVDSKTDSAENLDLKSETAAAESVDSKTESAENLNSKSETAESVDSKSDIAENSNSKLDTNSTPSAPTESTNKVSIADLLSKLEKDLI